MTFSIDSEQLRHLLKIVKPCAQAKTHDILRCVKFVMSQGKLTLSAFDGTQGVSSSIEIDFHLPLDIITPFKELATVAKVLKGEVTLDFTENTLLLSTKTASFKLTTLDTSEYPGLPITSSSEALREFKLSDNTKLLKKVLSTASTEEHRQILTGVSFKRIEANLVEIAATDSHRLATAKLQGIELNQDIVIDRFTLSSVLDIFSEAETIYFNNTEDSINFTDGTTTYFSRLLQGNFPKYEVLIPTKYKHSIEFDNNQIKDILSVVTALDSAALVRFDFNGDSCLVSSRSRDNEAKTTYVYDGVDEGLKDLSTAFNPHYLKEGLPDENFLLQFNNWNQPFVINSNDYTYLLMPVQVRD